MVTSSSVSGYVERGHLVRDSLSMLSLSALMLLGQSLIVGVRTALVICALHDRICRKHGSRSVMVRPGVAQHQRAQRGNPRCHQKVNMARIDFAAHLFEASVKEL